MKTFMGLNMRSYFHAINNALYALVIGLIGYLVDILETFSLIAINLQTLIEESTL